MDSKLVIFSSMLFALASASIIPTVEVLQGPSSKTTLVGPDGSRINSVAPGGQVVIDGQAVIPAAAALPLAAPELVLTGPAGSIITSHTAAGPAVVPALVSGLVHAGVADEGAYIPDNNEQLYDDGSYKGE